MPKMQFKGQSMEFQRVKGKKAPKKNSNKSPKKKSNKIRNKCKKAEKSS